MQTFEEFDELDEYDTHRSNRDKLRECIKDYWHYIEGDCYVPKKYLEIPSIDKTNLVMIEEGVFPGEYQYYTGCISATCKPYTLDEYQTKYCTKKNDLYYYSYGNVYTHKKPIKCDCCCTDSQCNVM
jgi:hypothetical protein